MTLATEPFRFRDRVHAGQSLAQELEVWKATDPIILGVPRGGVVVAAAIADLWDCAIDVLIARKIGAPYEPELALGAVTPDGHVVLDRKLIDHYSISEYQLTDLIERERREAQRRLLIYRGDRPVLDFTDRIVIVVDDGAATGATLIAALGTVRTAKPAELIAAVPVVSSTALFALEASADHVAAPLRPRALLAVGAYYEDFAEITDEMVKQIIARSGVQGSNA